MLLRPWREGDQPSLQRHANNPRVAANLRDVFPHPYTLADADWYIRTGCRHENQFNRAIVVEGQAVGGIGAVQLTDIYRASAEIGYWLGEEYWGRGLVTEALKQMVPMVFAHWPEVERIFAGVFEFNPASMRVLEKAGFVREAVLRRALVKHGRVYDDHFFAVWRS